MYKKPLSKCICRWLGKLKVGERGVAMRVDGGRLELNQLLFVNDVVLMADFEGLLQWIVNMLSLVGEKRESKI